MEWQAFAEKSDRKRQRLELVNRKKEL